MIIKNQHLSSGSIAGQNMDYFKKVTLSFVILLFSLPAFSQLIVNNVQLCAQVAGMPLFAQGDSYIDNSTGQPLELTLIEAPTGTSLELGVNYSMEQTLNFSQTGEYIFLIVDSLGLGWGNWNVESLNLASVSAGSSSTNICANDTVPLVGSSPIDNQGNMLTYFHLEWTQVDTLPAVEWIGASDVQIAHVTNFQVPGTYVFNYTLNPGTNCSSSDLMTVTVVICDSVTSVTSLPEIRENLRVYPTMIEDHFNVLNKFEENLQLELMDCSGRLAISEKISAGDNEIPTQNLPQGMYIYSISDHFGQILISGKVMIL